jgi:hypothetical protein
MNAKSKLPEYRHNYADQIEYCSKLRNLHGFESVFSVSGAVYNLARGERFLPTVAGKDVMMRFDYDGGFGNRVVGDVLINPTWLEVWAAADKAMRESGDSHHMFFECVYFRRMVRQGNHEMMVFELGFGS